MRIVVLIVLLAWAGSARAETAGTCKGHIDTLPAVLSSQGTWCLDHDLATSMTSGYAITVAAPNITIDCNGYKIGGLGAGPATNAIGIISNGHLNTVVRNCSIRGFYFGVSFINGGGGLLEKNQLDSNTLVGAFIGGDGSVVRDNRVLDTGNGTGYAWGIATSGSVDVLGNTVSGVYPDTTTSGYYGVGIQAAESLGSLIRGNIVRKVTAGVNGSLAIYVLDTSGRVVVQDNDVMYAGSSTSSAGIYCAGRAPLGIATGNTILRNNFPILGCFDGGKNVTLPLD